MTDIPYKFQTDENAKYLLSIIDTFTKFAHNYIMNNKMDDTVIGHLKDFIIKNGRPNSIDTDNGKEFCNKLIEEYCRENNINITHVIIY